MATLPTPEECGRMILDIYAQRNIRAGEMLLIQVLNACWIKDKNRSEDLSTGLEWLSEQGYVEQKEDKNERAFFLTEAGFEAL